MGEGTDNAIIPPRAILPRHTDDQRFQLLIDFGTAWRLSLLGAVKLLCD